MDIQLHLVLCENSKSIKIDHKKAQKTLERDLEKSKHTSAIMSAAQLATVMAKHKADGETIEANLNAFVIT